MRKRQEKNAFKQHWEGLPRFNVCSPPGVPAASFQYMWGVTKSGPQVPVISHKQWPSCGTPPGMFLLVSSWQHRYLTLAFPGHDSCMLAWNLRSFGVSQPTNLSVLSFFLIVLMRRRDLFCQSGRGPWTWEEFVFAAFAKLWYGYSRGKNHFLGQDTGLAPAALNGALTSPQRMHCTLEHVGLNPWIKLTPVGPGSFLIASPVLPGDMFLCRKFSTLS